MGVEVAGMMTLFGDENTRVVQFLSQDGEPN